MKKIIIALLVLALIWAIPAARLRFTSAMEPVLSALGPVGNRIANPAREFKAEDDLRDILADLRDLDMQVRARPTERGFSAWLGEGRGEKEDRSRDPWGNPYWIRTRDGETTIGSNGVDGKRDTQDDVTLSANRAR